MLPEHRSIGSSAATGCRAAWRKYGAVPMLLGLLMSVAVSVPQGHADDAALRGQAVVEQWCRACHLRVTDAPDPDMAPAFEEIVLRPRRTRGYLEHFLTGDHFPMTIFRLYESEKAEVLEYLMALKEQGGQSR